MKIYQAALVLVAAVLVGIGCDEQSQMNTQPTHQQQMRAAMVPRRPTVTTPAVSMNTPAGTNLPQKAKKQGPRPMSIVAPTIQLKQPRSVSTPSILPTSLPASQPTRVVQPVR